MLRIVSDCVFKDRALSSLLFVCLIFFFFLFNFLFSHQDSTKITIAERCKFGMTISILAEVFNSRNFDNYAHTPDARSDCHDLKESRSESEGGSSKRLLEGLEPK